MFGLVPKKQHVAYAIEWLNSEQESWAIAKVTARCALYTVSGKNHSISRRNFDNSKRSFVIFGTNHPATSVY